MRALIIFLVIVMILGVAGYFGVLYFINTKGKDILVDKIEDNFGEHAQVEALYFRFPFNIEIRNFSCGDISFKRADVFGGFYNPFTLQLVLNSVVIDEADIKIIRDKEKVHLHPFVQDTAGEDEDIKLTGNRGFIMPYAYADEDKKSSPPADKNEDKKFSLKIRNIYIKNSRGQFVDAARKQPVKFIFKDTSLKIRNFNYPSLDKFYIDFSAFFQTQGVEPAGKNVVTAKGWVDYAKKNMDVNLTAADVDCYAFGDYYPRFWHPLKLGVKQALLGLTTNLNSQDNELVIEGVLSLEKIDYWEPAQPVEEEAKSDEEKKVSDKQAYLKTVLALLQRDHTKPELNFKFKTKMDAPRIDISALKDNLKGVITIGAGTIINGVIEKIEKVKNAGDLSAEETVNATVETIKDVVDIFKGMF